MIAANTTSSYASHANATILNDVTHPHVTSLGTSDVTTVAIFSVVMSACTLATVLGNILVVLSVFTYAPLKNVQNYFVVSLACADLAVAVLVMPFNIANYAAGGRWRFGAVLCNAWLTFDILTCTASILHLCAIAVDRYYAIHAPIEYAMKRTHKRVIIKIALVWLASALISVPPLFGWNNSSGRGALYNAETRQCQLTDERGFVVYSALGSFYIPLFTMSFIYVKIFLATRARLRARRARTPGSATSTTTPSSGPARERPSAPLIASPRTHPRPRERYELRSGVYAPMDTSVAVEKKDKAVSLSPEKNDEKNETALSLSLEENEDSVVARGQGGGFEVCCTSGNNCPAFQAQENYAAAGIHSKCGTRDEFSIAVEHFAPENSADYVKNTSLNMANIEESNAISGLQSNPEQRLAATDLLVDTSLPQCESLHASPFPTNLPKIFTEAPRHLACCVTFPKADTYTFTEVIETLRETNCHESPHRGMSKAVSSPALSTIHISKTLFTPQVGKIRATPLSLCRSQILQPISVCANGRMKSFEGPEIVGNEVNDNAAAMLSGLSAVLLSLLDIVDIAAPCTLATQPSGISESPCILFDFDAQEPTPDVTSDPSVSKISDNFDLEDKMESDERAVTSHASNGLHASPAHSTTHHSKTNLAIGSTSTEGNNHRAVSTSVKSPAASLKKTIRFLAPSALETDSSYTSTYCNTSPRNNHHDAEADAAGVTSACVTSAGVTSASVTTPSQLTRFVAEKQRISLSKERRAARTMAIIMGAFVLCWLPFFLMYIIFPFCARCAAGTDRRVVHFIVWLGYVNSTLNPIIYTVFNIDFRRAFHRLLTGKCRLVR